MADWYFVLLQRETSQCPHLSMHGLQALHVLGHKYSSGCLCSSQFACVILLQLTLSLQIDGGVVDGAEKIETEITVKKNVIVQHPL